MTIFGRFYEIKLFGYFEGKIMMILIILNTVFIFKDFIEKYVPQFFDTNLESILRNIDRKFTIFPTIVVVLFAAWLYIKSDIDTTYLKYGLGF